jgi:hypothetical protein
LRRTASNIVARWRPRSAAPEEIKAISMSLGHDKVSTTLNDYGRMLPERQGEIIKQMRDKKKPTAT